MKNTIFTFFFLSLFSSFIYSQTTTLDLIISEYSEGSSYNKYIEIYNGTGVSIDLSGYEIWKITNGGSWPEQTLSLSGILLDKEVYVIAHGNADPSILIEADLITTSSTINFNGDDAIGIANLLIGGLIDMVGMEGPDPGSGWDVAGVSDATKDHTLVRKCSVYQGSIDWLLSAGLDSLSSEWIVLPKNDWSDIGTHTFPCQNSQVLGCTDSTATNYDPLATTDDGSCIFSCDFPTSLQLQTAFDVQAWVQWDEMSSATGFSNDSVDFYKVLYRAVGDTNWLIKQKTYDGHQTPIVRVRLQFLLPGTQYEMKIKAGYQSGCISDFSPIGYFYTLDECPNISNLSVSSPKSTKAIFSWDTSGTYSFVRIKLRVDTLNASWMSCGGFGVFYPSLSKAKNGLVSGESYRAQARTWCDPNGGPYRSISWSPLIFWTQPTTSHSRLMDGDGNVDNLDVYPNPSRDVFNVEFTSKTKQSIEVRVLNLVGEIIFTESLINFKGEYTHSFNFFEYSKGIYLLEIDTDKGIVSKKLILP